MGIAENQAIPGAWHPLFLEAMKMIDSLQNEVREPFWTFGGGTVMMLRHGHRMSKDVDIFLSDPQYLNYLTPRLNPVAEEVSDDYVEAGNYLKIRRAEGEIDFVVSENLTDDAFTFETILNHQVRVERTGEIVAKKMFHRGDQATARDLFDLAVAIQLVPGEVMAGEVFMRRHIDKFLDQVVSRRQILKVQFDEIDRLNFDASYDECILMVRDFFGAPRPVEQTEPPADRPQL